MDFSFAVGAEIPQVSHMSHPRQRSTMLGRVRVKVSTHTHATVRQVARFVNMKTVLCIGLKTFQFDFYFNTLFAFRKMYRAFNRPRKHGHGFLSKGMESFI
jgi:hypothetical protein